MSLLALWLATAQAGSGPWVVGRGAWSVYTGVEAQEFSKLAVQVAGERAVVDVDEGVSTLGAKVIATAGPLARMELEVGVPWYRVQVRRQGAVCASLGRGSCATTEGIGVISVRTKVLLLDELFGPPLSVSVGGQVNFGQLTHGQRKRITNLGEGTLDLGGFATAGRTGGLPHGGYWSTFVEASVRYRVPNTDQYPNLEGDTIAPGWEWTAHAEAALFFDPAVGFGPLLDVYHRPVGLDWDEVDLTDVDRLSALRVGNGRVGAVIVVRDKRNLAFVGSVSKTFWTLNNPNPVIVGLGVNATGLLRRKTEG